MRFSPTKRSKTFSAGNKTSRGLSENMLECFKGLFCNYISAQDLLEIVL